MRRAVRLLTLILLFTLGAIPAANAEKRLALVVGIDRYTNLSDDKQLRNAINDAETLAEALKNLGFSVDLMRNPNLDQMIEGVDRLAGQVSPGDTVLFFFSGHGISPDSVNLLLPSDFPSIRGDSAADRERARRSAYAEIDIISALRTRLADKEGRQQGLVLFVSDACRDNPFVKTASQGTKSLTRITHGVEAKPAEGVFSIYSAGLGQTALDRLSSADKNSVFMTEFVKFLPTQGRHLGDLMSEVKEQVAARAQTHIDPDSGRPHRQVPAIYDETVGGRIFLAGRSIGVEPAPPAGAVAPQPSQAPMPVSETKEPIGKGRNGDRAYLACVQNDDAQCYENFLTEFPDHPNAAQAQKLLHFKTELPRYQACVDGKEAKERLQNCEVYLSAFPDGKYQADARTLRDQALLDMRAPSPVPAQPQALLPANVSPPPPVAPAIPSPGFSCAKARHAAEIAVCNTPLLASLDFELNQIFVQASVGPRSKSVKAQQPVWIKSRNACGADVSCLERSYRAQINFLRGAEPIAQTDPSFPCAKARHPAELAVCNSALLAGLDVELNQIYERVKARGLAKQLAKQQRSWVDRRNACGSDASCIEQRYREQIGFLQSTN